MKLTAEQTKAMEKLAESLVAQGGKTTSQVGMALREENRQVIKEHLINQPEVKELRESIQRRFGIDVCDSKEFKVMERKFSWRKLKTKLAEADSASSFTQFLRAGIQQIASSMYESVPTTYEDWVTVIDSNKDTELYAPHHGVSFPREVGPQVPYPQVKAAALDLKLKNRKYGSVYGVEHELLEDDQTGQFRRQSGMLGSYLKILSEVLCYGKLASVANMRYIEYDIPVSETQPASEASYPWSTGLVGGGANRPVAYGALNQANIQNGFIGLMQQKNLHGINMLVQPNRILAGPSKSFDLAVLLNSAYYPSGAAAAGDVGGAFAINPIKGIADATISRFIPKNDGTFNADSTAWYLVDDSQPWFVLQMREALSIIQESPDSGQSFDLDIYRFKSRARQNADFVDPRFAWQGSDGSA